MPDVVATSGDAHNADFKGLTYVLGAAAASEKGVKLPEDNQLKESESSTQHPMNNDRVSVNYSNGSLMVSKSAGKVVNVYSVSGALIDTFTAEGDECIKPIDLPKGVYVVSIDAVKQTIIAR